MEISRSKSSVVYVVSRGNSGNSRVNKISFRAGGSSGENVRSELIRDFHDSKIRTSSLRGTLHFNQRDSKPHSCYEREETRQSCYDVPSGPRRRFQSARRNSDVWCFTREKRAMRLDQLRTNGREREREKKKKETPCCVYCAEKKENERKRRGGEKDGKRNPLSAINRIKDDFPRPEEMSRENSSSQVEPSRRWGTIAGWSP